jgi:adenine phosphoribosyltransferase
MQWKELIRSIPDWPKPGILFRDITPILRDGAAFAQVVEQLARTVKPWKADVVVATEARGFIFGAAVSLTLGLGFVPVRKKGKLPAAAITEEYALEYGTDIIQMHADALGPGTRAVLIDDLLATGGTAAACARLIRRSGATLAGIAFVIELAGLDGMKALPQDVPRVSLVVL